MSIRPDQVGTRVEGHPYEVTAEEIVAFALATNDRNPRYLAAEIAPPIYALNPVLEPMVAAKSAVTKEFGFHGEHEIRFHRPIRAGMRLKAVASVAGVRGRSSGVAIYVTIATHDGEGALVNEQGFISFVSNAVVSESRGEEPPRYALPGDIDSRSPAVRVDYAMDPDQTRRYAAASHDHDAYTVDEAVARKMGFPTLLVHGMCTFAFAARAIVNEMCGGDPERLTRIAVRLSRPVYLVPEQRLTTSIWPLGSGVSGDMSCAYTVIDAAGETVMTNGYAEVRA